MKAPDINGKERLWKELKEKDKKGIKEVSKENSQLILNFLKDYSLGLNVGNIKGKRSSSTLTKQRYQLVFISNQINKSLNKVSKEELHTLFNKMDIGEIKKKSGNIYLGVSEYIKVAKSFYGWLIRKGMRNDDPTEDLTMRSNGRKPPWVYLTQEQMKTLINQARGDYRALILFIYDSGARPEEAWRLRVSDFRNEFTELNIPKIRDNGENVSKTFERTIKLTQCSKLIKEYIKINDLKCEDLLINIKQPTFNKYLRELAKRLFGNETTKARAKPSQMKCYDIRHNSCIYYLGKYKRNSDLMYRFGWKQENKIFYYSEFLGKTDNIDEDMITEEDKNKYEKQIEELKNMIGVMQKEIEFFRAHLQNREWEDIRTGEKRFINSFQKS